ncbi:unnamed protein product [Victoria cruziana]
MRLNFLPPDSSLPPTPPVLASSVSSNLAEGQEGHLRRFSGSRMAILTMLPSSALPSFKGVPGAFLSKGGVPIRTATCSLKTGSGGPAKGPAPRLTPCLSGPGEPSSLPPGEPCLISSATAAASVILRASPSPVEFVQRIEKARDKRVALPSPEFQRLCHEQLDLFRRLVHEDAILSVYVRPAGSYVMDRLELWRVTLHTTMNMAEEPEVVVLIGKFCLPAGLREVEAAMAAQLIEDVPECRALVLPMVKDPFLVGFLVAELPPLDARLYMDEQRSDDPIVHVEPAENEADNFLDELEFHPLKKLRSNYFSITSEQKSGAVNISRSLAVAYVMDQKTLLLQHSSWQNNIRISNLVEQIRGSLSSIRALSKMLSIHLKKDEISYDIAEDILVQGDQMKDNLHELQNAVYLTKANIMRHNEDNLKKRQRVQTGYGKLMHTEILPGDTTVGNILRNDTYIDLSSDDLKARDLEIPMPPVALVAQHTIRPCNVSNVLAELVGVAQPLAHKQQRSLKVKQFNVPLEAAVEEAALRQALSNLIDGALLRTHVGGKVEIISVEAPGGGVLIVVDDDGPDMHYMTQMYSLAPFAAEISSQGMVEDSMTWNFVAGLTVAREILESYGCVVRIISPHFHNTSLGAGGTRVELWLPALQR